MALRKAKVKAQPLWLSLSRERTFFDGLDSVTVGRTGASGDAGRLGVSTMEGIRVVEIRSYHQARQHTHPIIIFCYHAQNHHGIAYLLYSF